MWRKVTTSDLLKRITQEEIDAYESAKFDVDNAAEVLLGETTAYARGFLRSNRAIVLTADTSLVPEMLVATVVDLAVFDLLRSMGISPNDAQTNAKTSAVALLTKIAEGRLLPEWAATAPDGSDQIACSPLAAPASPPRLLD